MALAAGDEIPEGIRNSPVLQDGLELFYFGFWELITCQVDGVTPWTAVKEWATYNELDGLTFEIFYRHFRALEGIYRKAQKANAKPTEQRQSVKAIPRKLHPHR